MNNIVEICYLAGMLDSEGTISISKVNERNYQIRLSVGNTSELIIDYLVEVYGGNKGGPYKSNNENGRDRYDWNCSSYDAIKLIKKVQPYLIVKQAQADLAISAWNDTFRIDYNNRGPGQVPKFSIDKREYYRQEMKKLNMKGKQEGDKEEGISYNPRHVISLYDYLTERESPNKTKFVMNEYVKYKDENNTLKLAYLAAMIDGDGTIRIKRSKQKYTIYISVKNTSEALMDYLKENFKGKKLGPYSNKIGKNWKDYFLWECSSKEAIKIIKQIEPYLIIKRQQANLAIEAWEDTFRIDYNTRGPERIPKFAINKREYYYQQMKMLNKTGKHEDEEIVISLKINKNTLQRWLKESE